MQIRRIIFLCSVLLGGEAFAGDTNFVSTFNSLWQSGNASNVLSYVDGYLATNRNAEALFARGIVAAGLQNWGRGATNYLSRAIAAVNADIGYTPEQKQRVSNDLARIQDIFVGLLQDTGEPGNSSPSWDTNVQAKTFIESGGEAPFLHILNEILMPQ